MGGGGEKKGELALRSKMKKKKKKNQFDKSGGFFLGSFKLSIVVADRDLEI